MLPRLLLSIALALMSFSAPSMATDYYDPSGMQVNQGVITCVNGNGSVSPCSPVEVCVALTVTLSSAYTANNEVGGLVTVPIPATAPGQILQSIRMDFKDAQTAEFDVWQFSANPSNSTWTDKTGPAINAADVFKVLPPFKLTNNASGLGTHTVYGQDAIARSLARTTASDYFVVTTTGTPTFTNGTASTNAQLCASYL